MTREFNDWVDVDGLTPAERERLERVHALLVAAGPPPELTAAIEPSARARDPVPGLAAATAGRSRSLPQWRSREPRSAAATWSATTTA